MFEILEHTADIGFRARGRTIEELFEQAAEALAAIAIELDDVRPAAKYPLSAAGDDRESLLVNWLNEALYLLDGKQVAPRRFKVHQLTGSTASGEAEGEPRDAARHRAKLVVKGVTYHQLSIREDGPGWVAEVYLDI
jgi:SHS2 domain-containing protein